MFEYDEYDVDDNDIITSCDIPISCKMIMIRQKYLKKNKSGKIVIYCTHYSQTLHSFNWKEAYSKRKCYIRCSCFKIPGPGER